MNSTIVLGLASIALAAAFRTQTSDYPETAQRLPVLLIWLIIGLAVSMIAEDLMQRRKASRAAVLPVVEDDAAPPVNWPVLAGFAVAIVAYVALIPLVGYLVTTTAFIAGSLLVSRIMPPVKAVLIGILATASVWVVFIYALNLPVPILPFLK